MTLTKYFLYWRHVAWRTVSQVISSTKFEMRNIFIKS